MPILSPNMLKIFEQCPYKYKLKYANDISLIQNSNIFKKGKKIHALASYYLQGFEIKKFEKALSDNENKIWQQLKSNKYFQMQTIKTEYNLSCKVDKYWIGGRLDALVRNSQDYYILDYKTGQIPNNAQEDFQTITYLLSADKYLNKKDGYKSLSFVYLGLKNNEEKIIELNTANKKLYEEKIISTCRNIELNKFSTTKINCKNCEYKNFCE